MKYFRGKNGVFVIAEIGGNHEGNFEYAQRLTRLAADSGVDAIKFQIYSGDHLVNPLIDPDRNRHFKRFQLTKDQYIDLANLCRQLGVIFMASVWDISALSYIDEFMPIYKIGSGDLTTHNIIKRIAEIGKPIILSTGLADLEEVLHTVEFICSIDSSYQDERKLALLQCTSMYPIPDEDANLNSMILIRERTGLPVGFSDHTVGTYACEVAVAMGAQVIEKHFTDQREGRQFRDHKISLTQEEMQELIHKFKKIKELQGTYDKRIMPSEIDNECLISFRRAVYPRRDLQAGALLTREDIISLRPNVGIDGRDYFKVLGKKLKVNKKAYECLSWDELE